MPLDACRLASTTCPSCGWRFIPLENAALQPGPLNSPESAQFQDHTQALMLRDAYRQEHQLPLPPDLRISGQGEYAGHYPPRGVRQLQLPQPPRQERQVPRMYGSQYASSSHYDVSIPHLPFQPRQPRLQRGGLEAMGVVDGEPEETSIIRSILNWLGLVGGRQGR